MILVLALVLLLSGSLAAQSPPSWEWRWVNPKPTANHLIEVFFPDALRGIAVAANGETVETSDGGETWKAHPGRIPNNYMVSATTLDGVLILGVAGDGTIWKTGDGGRSWSSSAKESGSLFDIAHAGGDVVLAVGARGIITRSENRGETWARVRSDSLGHDLVGIHCLADGFAVAVGRSGTVLKTRDGGKTWTRLPSPADGVNLSGVAFADTAKGYATAENGRVLSTSDGGETWHADLLDSLAFFRGIRWRDGNLTITGSEGSLWKSRNGGGTWSREETGTTRFLAASAFVGSDGEITVGNDGTILMSSDSGSSWKSRAAGSTKEILGMTTLGPSKWVAFGAKSLIMKTLDGGRTWQEKPGPDSMYFLSGAFMGRKGLLGSHAGALFRSEDEGETWSETSIKANGRRMFGVAWCDSTTALAVGDSGTLLRSTDAGITWSPLPGISGVTDQTLSAVACQASGTAHVVGYEGLILKSGDKGASWATIPTPVDENLFGLSFLDASTGMAVGNHGTILLTEDGGDSWKKESTGKADDWVLGAVWLGRDTAVVVAYWGHFSVTRMTRDGGKTWSELPNATESALWALTGVDSGRVAVMGQGGIMLLGNPVQTPIGIRNALSRGGFSGDMRASRMGSLPRIKITFTAASRTRVRIDAYSLEGRLKGEIFRGETAPGRQSLVLPYPSQGPAILRLTGGGKGKERMFCLLSD